jgi:hypothetical protein
VCAGLARRHLLTAGGSHRFHCPRRASPGAVLWERGWNLRELTGCEAKKRGGQVLAPSPRFSQITNKRVSQTRPSKRGDFCSRMIRDAVRPSEKACCMALAWQNTVDPLLGNLLETCLWPLHSHISIIAIFSQMMGLSCQSRLGRSSRYAFSNLINNSRFTKVGHEPWNSMIYTWKSEMERCS